MTDNIPSNSAQTDQTSEVFMLARDRDAYATIRGFFFQAERTIQRWIHLDLGQKLELECGEDIDIVAQQLVNDQWQEERLLEQLKSWEKNITLISGREAIANFHEHRTQNPGLDLRFCLTTNAHVGIERPPLFKKDRRSGIEWWRSLSRQELEEIQQAGVLTAIRSRLSICSAPEKFNADTWEAFRQFAQTGDEDEWLDFITRFEWMTGIANPLNLSQEIQTELLDRKIASDEATSRAIYERLFVFAIRLLSQKGRKILEAKGWKEVIKTLPSVDDQPLLSHALSRIDEFDQKIAAIDARLAMVEERQDKLEFRMGRVESQAQDAQSTYTVLLEIIETGQDLTEVQLNRIRALLDDMQRTRSKEEIHNSPQAQAWTVEIRIDEARKTLEEGKFHAALKRLEKLHPLVLALSDEDDRRRQESRLCGLSGFCHWRLGEMKEANDLFAKAFSLQPDSAKACANAAYGALLVEKFQDALRLAEKALALDSANDDALSMAVRALHLLKCGAEIGPLLQKHPEAANGLQTLFTRGGIAIEDGDYELAQSLATEVRDLAPNNPMVHRLYLDAHFGLVQQQLLNDNPMSIRLTPMQQDFAEKAEASASRALELMDEWDTNAPKIDIYIARASVREVLSNIEGAIADCDEILRYEPENETAHFIKGEILLHSRHEFNSAVSEFQKVKSGYLVENAKKLQAEALVNLEKWDEVINLLEPIYSPEASRREQMDLARLLLQAAYGNKNSTLVAKLKHELETHYPNEMEALVTLSDLARWERNTDLSLELLQKALKLANDSNKDHILFWIARVHRDSGDFLSAAATLESIIDLTTPDLLLQFYLENLSLSGDSQKAAEIASQIRKGGRAIAGISEHEAFFASNEKNYDLASQLFEQLSEDEPNNILHIRNAAMTLLHNFPPAVTLEDVKDNPTLPSRIERARIILRRITLDSVADPCLMMELASLRQMSGFADAIDWAYRALRLSPGDGHIRGAYTKFFLSIPENDRRFEIRIGEAERAVEIQEESSGGIPKRQVWIITTKPLGGEFEIRPSEPLAQELLQKGEGEVVTFKPGSTLSGSTWKITSVKNKYVHALHESMDLLQSGLVSDSSIVVGKFDTPEELALRERELAMKLLADGESIENIFEKVPVTVAGLAQLTGQVIPDFWRSDSEKGGYTLEQQGRFHVADGRESEIHQHRQVALNSTGFVLDWTALITLTHLHVGDAIKKRYPRLVVPQMLADEIKEYKLRHGSVISPLQEDDRAKRRREFINQLAQFMHEKCEVVNIVDWCESDDNMAKAYGRSAFAAIRLAGQEKLPLWSDDLRTRSLATIRFNGLPSVAVQWLLLVLRADKHLHEGEYFEAVKKLIYAGYGFLWITIPFILWTFRQSNMNVTDEVRGVLSYLSYWKVTDQLAASLIAGVIVALWREPILEHRRRALIDAMLDALVASRPTYQIIKSLHESLRTRLNIDVTTHSVIRQVIDDWSKRHVQVVKSGDIIKPGSSLILPP